MSVDPATFETLHPSRYTTFTFPNPNPTLLLHTPLLRVAVLDSPVPPTHSLRVAAMLVPLHRESDWTFSTESGLLHLLYNTTFSRLILIGNSPISHNSPISYTTTTTHQLTDYSLNLPTLQQSLYPLLFSLTPRSCFSKSLPEIPFLEYEDDVVSSVVVELCVGDFVGEMMVEDVELCGREFRRRLRLKRMPNLIQSQIRIFHKIQGGELCCDLGVLVHPYLAPMVAGVSVIGEVLDERVRGGVRPRALCLGVGGGALLGFLSDKLGFEVVGVEADEVVLGVARKYFGLGNEESIKVCVGDAIELIENVDSKENGLEIGKFDVVMVDLDSSDAKMGVGAPPLEFIRKSLLFKARMLLHEHGILVINVIPSSEAFYEILIRRFHEVFEELYEIDVGNGENYIVIAVASVGTISFHKENDFMSKLKLAIQGLFTDSIRKI